MHEQRNLVATALTYSVPSGLESTAVDTPMYTCFMVTQRSVECDKNYCHRVYTTGYSSREPEGMLMYGYLSLTGHRCGSHRVSASEPDEEKNHPHSFRILSYILGYFIFSLFFNVKRKTVSHLYYFLASSAIISPTNLCSCGLCSSKLKHEVPTILFLFYTAKKGSSKYTAVYYCLPTKIIVSVFRILCKYGYDMSRYDSSIQHDISRTY